MWNLGKTHTSDPRKPAGPPAGSGESGREGPGPDGVCGVIYDPGGEPKLSCPPQTALSNEKDALFSIKAAQPEFWEREPLKPHPASRNSASSLSSDRLWSLELLSDLISVRLKAAAAQWVMEGDGRAAFVL